MTLSAKKHPVELLRDGKGIYGIGVAKEAETDHQPSDVILRRDRLPAFETRPRGYPILQMIAGGFRHGMFRRTAEELHRRVIHHEMLRRAGLAWPPPGAPFHCNGRYWSSDPRQQNRNRQIYHGLRLRSLSVVNSLIGRALEEAANSEVVKIARRFQFRYRYSIYCAASQNPRAMQITNIFPALSLAIFAQGWDPNTYRAAELVEAGAPLKKIADLMHIPMAFQKVKPAAAELALFVVDAVPDQRLIHAYMPDSLPRMKLWFRCIHLAKGLGPEFIEWVAKHSHEIAGTPREVLNFLSDLTDWVAACHRASVPPHIFSAIIGDKAELFQSPRGEQFIIRAFSPDMSLKTVTKLSSDWHEAVANNMSGPLYEFPEPWCHAGESCGYEIVPIVTSADLYREGHALHHCVGTQGHRVRTGETYFYSIRRQKERVATLELLRHGEGAALGQLRGSCNSQVSKKLMGAARSWLRSQREFHFPKERRVADDDIPF